MKFLKYVYISFLFIAFNSCKNDVPILADWKETTIVYGLLNQSDTAQYIRINKAFLGEGNALQMAQVYDSIQYGNVLSVKLERVKNGSVIETILMQRDSSLVKSSGTFSAPAQILYKTKNTLYDDSQYELTILNNKTGNVVKSKTVLVKDFSVSKPHPSLSSISFLPYSVPIVIQWITGANGRLYDATLRFHYTEETATDTVQKSVDMYLGSDKTSGLGGGKTQSLSFSGIDFYRFLSIAIKPDANVKRIAGKINFVFSAAGDDLSTYMEVNQPSTGIVQDKPEFTNIENGYGIFSSRYTKVSQGLSISGLSGSLDSLYAGQYTSNLSFCDPAPGGPYSCN